MIWHDFFNNVRSDISINCVTFSRSYLLDFLDTMNKYWGQWRSWSRPDDFTFILFCLSYPDYLILSSSFGLFSSFNSFSNLSAICLFYIFGGISVDSICINQFLQCHAQFCLNHSIDRVAISVHQPDINIFPPLI